MEGVVIVFGVGNLFVLFCERCCFFCDCCGILFKWKSFLNIDLKFGFMNEYSKGFIIELKVSVNGESRVMCLGNSCGFLSV